IGMGSIILNKAKIGPCSIVGAGSVITEGKEFPPNSLIVGAPAQVKKTLPPETVEAIKAGVETYKRLALEYLEAFSEK
ncbi:MAG: hypothetical protein QXZ24_02440, partial [Candidatus Jordarchaeales archaeon]